MLTLMSMSFSVEGEIDFISIRTDWMVAIINRLIVNKQKNIYAGQM